MFVVPCVRSGMCYCYYCALLSLCMLVFQQIIAVIASEVFVVVYCHCMLAVLYAVWCVVYYARFILLIIAYVYKRIWVLLLCVLCVIWTLWVGLSVLNYVRAVDVVSECMYFWRGNAMNDSLCALWRYNKWLLSVLWHCEWLLSALWWWRYGGC